MKICGMFFSKRAKDCADMIGHCHSSELLQVGVSAGSRNVICSWGLKVQDIEYSLLPIKVKIVWL